MKKIIRLSESQLVSLIEKVIKEQEEPNMRVHDLPPVTITAKRPVYKIELKRPTEDGYTMVSYNTNTGKVLGNDDINNVIANLNPNKTEEEVKQWLERNRIKVK